MLMVCIALKKKHSKTGEESRYQGTVLGKGADPKPVRVDGGALESIKQWESTLRRKNAEVAAATPYSRMASTAPLSSLGSPLSEIGE
jgi:transcription initiation factor TFIID subunit 3